MSCYRGLLLLLLSCAAFAQSPLSNRRAPGFSLSDRTMRQHDLADYRGKVVLLEIMQTKCPHCKTQAGTIQQVKAKYGDQIQVLAVVTMPDTMNDVAKFASENAITSPILFDCGQMIASYLKITPQNPTVKFPHLFVIDQSGMIRADFNADQADKGAVTVRSISVEVDKLLAGAAPKTGAAPKKR